MAKDVCAREKTSQRRRKDDDDDGSGGGDGGGEALGTIQPPAKDGKRSISSGSIASSFSQSRPPNETSEEQSKQTGERVCGATIQCAMDVADERTTTQDGKLN